MSTDQLRQHVQKLVAEKLVTVSALARDVGYSHAAISQWLSGTYKANPQSIHAAMEGFLKRFETGDVGFIPTETATTVFDACETACEEGEIAIVMGDPGVGKTEALKEFQRRFNAPPPKSKIEKEVQAHTDPRPVRRVIYYPVIFRMRPKTLLQELARQLNVAATGTAAEIAGRLIDSIRRTPTLLVIDEADHLDVPSLESLRHLHDQTGVGLVLAGTKKLELLFTGGGQRSVELAQLYSRVGYRVEVHGCTTNELKTILTQAFGGEVRDDVIHEFSERCGSSMRLVSKLLARTRKILDMTRCALVPAVVRRAADKTSSVRSASRSRSESSGISTDPDLALALA
jgi:DNA transposition AAA+ family ATPase